MTKKITFKPTLAVLGCVLMGLMSTHSMSLAAPADPDNEQVDVLTNDEKNVADNPPEKEKAKPAADKAATDKAAAKAASRAKSRADKAAARKVAEDTAAAERAANGLQMRARMTAMTPALPVSINWRYGGEAMGGDVVSGALGQDLALGQWTELKPLLSIVKGAKRNFFLTVTASPPALSKADKKTAVPRDPLTNVEMEFEFSVGGKTFKTVKAKGPNGATVDLVIPGSLLDGGEEIGDPQVVAGLESLQDYALARAKALEALPWAKGPVPDHYTIFTDLGGYGTGVGRGIRHTDPAIVDAELRSLRQLGVNGLRAMPDYMLEKMAAGGYPDFRHGLLVNSMGFPVVRYRKGRGTPPPNAGCPYGPEVPELTRLGVEGALTRMLALPAQEVWGLTDDEIGSVFDQTPEGKAHMATHDLDIAAYQVWLKAKGLKPSDFGQKEWAAVSPVNLWNRDKSAPGPDFADPHVALNAYYTKAFNNYSTAKLFTPLREAFDAANAQKRAALAAGQKDSAVAKQPWVYSYALRGNSFLLGGHSLDFFEFYRYADNAFVYETSNRDARIWGWDSYLCDVGRMITTEQKQQLGIYIKPHRGAPVQRALSAVSRGASMIYWYTYGPDYFKGDSFSSRESTLEDTSKAAHLIGKTEDVLHDSQWAKPAEVAIMKPFSLMAWRGGGATTAAWEDTKWTYSALQHAHIPVDPIDEVMVNKNDLSRYKVIYLPSTNLREDSAAKIAAWVQAGGTLVTNADGLARDEANQPLNALVAALGLTKRTEPEMWFNVKTYGSTSLQSYPEGKDPAAPPAGAVVTAASVFDKAPLQLTIGREVLQPAAGTDVLARFADGGAASTLHKFGKGKVYVNGFFPGLEYSIPVRNATFDMDKDFSAATRSFIAAPAREAGVLPVVDAAAPTVEGVLLKNAKTGARAVTLMNWGYRIETEPVPQRQLVKHQNLKIAIRGAGPVTEVRSAWLDKALPMKVEGDVLTVTLPELEEGDVLLLK